MQNSPETDSPAAAEVPEASFLASVEYSREALDRLRLVALDGLLALPRVGIGIGGFLVGTFTDGCLDILDFMEIPCSHKSGPSFSLSPEEIDHARELAVPASPHVVVGVYCSKTRAALVPGDADRELFEKLCPAPWQVMLLMRPSTVQHSRAALFRRGRGGLASLGVEWDLEPLEAEFVEALEAEPVEALEAEPVEAIEAEAVEAVAPEPLKARAAATGIDTSGEFPARGPALVPDRRQLPEPDTSFDPQSPHTLATLAPTLALAEDLAAAPPREWPPQPRLFMLSGPPPPRRVLPWILAALLFAGVGGTAWVTKDSWIPRPPLTLEATDLDGHVTLRWNVDAVRGGESGSLFVNDGQESQQFALTPQMLEAGVMGYDRKNARVTATLRVGETRASASFERPPALTKPAP